MSLELHVTDGGMFVIAHGELDDRDIAVLRARCARGDRLELDLRDVASVDAESRRALDEIADVTDLHVFGLSPRGAGT